MNDEPRINYSIN